MTTKVVEVIRNQASVQIQELKSVVSVPGDVVVQVLPSAANTVQVIAPTTALVEIVRGVTVQVQEASVKVVEVSVVGGGGGGSGADGDDGWAPVLAVEIDGERRVLEVIDWVGGSGAMPPIGLYVGLTGLVANIADAVDVRGPAGADGIDGLDAATWFQGSGPPSDELGMDDDSYLDVDTGDVYLKYGESWGPPTGNLKGPQGDPASNLVTSVFGRQGAVTAQANDYDISQISGVGTLATLNEVSNAQVAAAAAIALTKLATIAASTILGSIAGGTPTALTATQVKTLLAIAAGDVSDLGTLATLNEISNAQVSATAAIALSKLANISNDRLLGNNIGGAGPPIALTPAQVKTLLAIAVGDVSGAAVDADVVHLAGTETITGNKTFTGGGFRLRSVIGGNIEELVVRNNSTGQSTQIILDFDLGASGGKTVTVTGNATIPPAANSITKTELAANSVDTTQLVPNSATNAVLADMDEGRIKARISAGTGNPQDATAAQVRGLLNVADGAETSRYQSIRSIGSGTSNSLITDAQSIVRIAVANGDTTTYRLNGSVSYATGDWIDLHWRCNTGSATLNVTTINGASIDGGNATGISIGTRGSFMRLTHRGGGNWMLAGNGFGP